jgi:hypothetical protein
MSAALAASAVLLADDVSGVGLADDLLIPFLLGAAYLSDLYREHILESRKPKNRLPEKTGEGPVNGKLERRDPQTGELLQERWYGPRGEPTLDKDYGHDHGQGDPHLHEWHFPSPQAPNPIRGGGKRIK